MNKINLLTSEYLFNIKNGVLNELGNKEKAYDYHRKLKNYKYIEDIDDLSFGAYIRWFKCDEKILKTGGLVCNIEEKDDGTAITCKSNVGKFITIYFEESYIFQKLTSDEIMMITLLDKSVFN
tara:strand:- start:10474 stop:10842 length:369 start_codon:yes stop_codon:yes gene_type:complete